MTKAEFLDHLVKTFYRSGAVGERSLAAWWLSMEEHAKQGYEMAYRTESQPPNGPHRHKCGYSAAGDLPGCGQVFEHEMIPVPKHVRVSSSHMCPNCGKGPWYKIWTEGAI